jgi:ferredoxin-NADP reductase/nitrite reductase/ring-hydroxylating ferredoxin subunit
MDVTKFFHPVIPAKELRDAPLRVELAGRRYALFRDGTGKPAALADACPHRNAPLSSGKVEGGRLKCAYHGWNFDAEGRGRSPAQPKLAGCNTLALQVVERYGYLWIAAKDVPLSRFPKFDVEGFEYAGAFSTFFKAPLHVALDNFSEDEHFPYIHSFFGWGEDGWAEVEHEARLFDDRTEVHYEGPQRPSGWLPLLGVRKGDRFHNDWVTRFDPVCAVFTFHWYDPKTKEERPFVSRAAIFMVPETEKTTRFHSLLFLKLGNAFLRASRPAVYRVAMNIARDEVGYDADFMPLVADTPESLAGMWLGKFDKALIRNRRLLRTHYFGETAGGNPDWREFVVAKKQKETDAVTSFYLEPRDKTALPPFAPGQHLTFRLAPEGRERPVVRCYSLSDSHDARRYRVTIKREGLSSSHLHDHVHEGDVLHVKAPTGNFCLDPSSPRPVVLVGGGVGITPLLSMLNAIVALGGGRETWLFYGARSAEQCIMREHLEAVARKHPNVHLTFALSGAGERVTPELLKKTLPSSGYDFYVCGPPGMTRAVTEGLAAWGVPDNRVHFEAFGPSTVKSLRNGEGNGTATFDVTFRRSGRTVPWRAGISSLLELADKSGIVIESGCRAGSCSTCVTKLVAGDVRYLSEPGEIPAAGTCLPCICVPTTAVELEA